MSTTKAQSLLKMIEDIHIYHDGRGNQTAPHDYQPASSASDSSSNYGPPKKKSKAGRLIGAAAIGIGAGLLGAAALHHGSLEHAAAAAPSIGTPGEMGGTGLPKMWARGA